MCVACQHPTHIFFHKVGVVWEYSPRISGTAEPACTRNPLCLSTLIQLHDSHPPLPCFSSSSCSCAFISLANLLYLPTEFSAWWKPPAHSFFWSRHLSGLRHVDIIGLRRSISSLRSSLISQTVVYTVGSLGNFSLRTWSRSLGQKLMNAARLQTAPWRQAGRMHTRAGFSRTQTFTLKYGEKLYCGATPCQNWWNNPVRILSRQVGFFPSVFSVFRVDRGIS